VNNLAKDVVNDPISTDLKKVMHQLKLSPMRDTLPDRLALARQQHLSHAAFLELVLADEVTRATPVQQPGGPALLGWTPPCASTAGTRTPPCATTGPYGPT